MQGCRAVLFAFIFVQFCVLSVQKCKKMQKNAKNAKKMQKNLLISKKSCNFAPSFKKMNDTTTQLETQKQQTK